MNKRNGNRILRFAGLGALVVAGGALLLARPLYRTWQSYYEHQDHCGNSASITRNELRIAAAIAYIRRPSFRHRALIQTKGRLDTWTRLDPAHCCSVVFGGRVGDYAITPRTIFHGGPTAYVRFNALPPFTAGGEKLSLLTDPCGEVYELRS